MSKAYLLTEADLQNLLTRLDRNPEYGLSGGSSAVLSKEEKEAFHSAHRFYNYQVRVWLDEIKK